MGFIFFVTVQDLKELPMSILAKTQGTATKSSSSVRLRDRFDIRYDRSMPQFQSSPASVFAATDLQSPTAGPSWRLSAIRVNRQGSTWSAK